MCAQVLMEPRTAVDGNTQWRVNRGEVCVTESMSVLADPATYCIFNSELTHCPRTAAILGEMATQWKHIMASLQRGEQETATIQNLANAIQDLNRTRIHPTANRLRLKDVEELVGQHITRRVRT